MRRQHWNPSTPTAPAPTELWPAQHKPLHLRCEDYFERRSSCFGSAWALRSKAVSWVATLLNLYLLLNAVRALHSFRPLNVDDYAITSLASRAECVASRQVQKPADAAAHRAAGAGNSSSSSMIHMALGSLQHGLETLKHDMRDLQTAAVAAQPDDLASIMRQCRGQLAAAETHMLRDAKVAYSYAAHVFIVVAMCLDFLRWCGCCSAPTDAVLGFRSARAERLRLLPQTLMLVPFAHLTYLLWLPIEQPCCVARAYYASLFDRVRVLAWLCIIVSYCLFADSHNSGYFLLRSADRAAASLLRPQLGIVRGEQWASKV